ncbi:MAG TPA: hypothetical protein VJN62_16445 [Gemmatimonadales bacterium]|nr:hypothetical protein [Gemmatimonadales bacterium]
MHKQPSFSSAWADEPANFTSFAEYGFDTTLGSGLSILPAGGEWTIYNPNGNASQGTTATDAPLSPPNIGQFSYPVGFQSGTSPAVLSLESGQNKEVFVGAWWKSSSPWHDPDGANTVILSLETGASVDQTIYLELSATGSTPPHRLDVLTQFPGTSLRLAPNTTVSDVSLGSWHRLEMYVKYSTTPTSNDGIIRWWLDGVLQGDYVDQNMPADAGVVGYRVQPARIGGDTSTEQDYFWYDQIHVGVPSTSAWPDEPAGFTTIDDYGFPDSVPADTAELPIPGGSGWKSVFNHTGTDGVWNTSRVDDATAPFSPTSVVQWRYPAGFAGGSAPGTLFFGHSSQTEVFAGFWWKPSSPWQNHPSNVNKIAFWYTGGSESSIDIQMYGTGGDTAYELQVVSEFTNIPSTRFPPNLTATNITLGQWHRVEWHMRFASTPGGSDGVLEWWLDGVPQARYTNLQTPNDAGFDTFKFSPTWGGVDGLKTETDYYWVDQVHLSHN